MTLRRYTARWSTPLSRSSTKRCCSLSPWHDVRIITRTRRQIVFREKDAVPSIA
jgi:hypothetical protein